MRRINSSVMSKGYPAFSGGFTKAPFDVIGDTLRGTLGVMSDIYRHPEELMEAWEDEYEERIEAWEEDYEAKMEAWEEEVEEGQIEGVN